MTFPFATPEKPRPRWQVLLAPMLLASLGLHGLVLMLPSGSADEVVIPPPDLEQDSVAITRVPPAGEPEQGTASGNAAAEPTAQTQAMAASPVQAAAQPPAVTQTRPPAQPQTRPQAQPQARPQARQQVGPQTQPQAQPEANQPPQNTAPAPNDTSGPAATTPPPPAPTSLRFESDIGDLLAYVAGLNLSQGKIDRAAEYIENRFAFDREAITRSALSANQQRWEAALREQTGGSDLAPEPYRDRFTAVYRQRVCLGEMPGEIRIGALVNPDGTWRGEPTLLRSSGYGALDRRALRDIQSHRFEPAASVQAHILTIDTSVDYGGRPCLDPDTVP